MGKRTWGPSGVGRWLKRAKPWSLTLDESSVLVEADGASWSIDLDDASALTLSSAAIWSQIVVPSAGGRTTLTGIPNRKARGFSTAVKLARRSGELDLLVDAIHEWSVNVQASADARIEAKRWLTTESVAEWNTHRPGADLAEFRREPQLRTQLEAQAPEIAESIAFWEQPLVNHVRQLNAALLESELVDSKTFFDTVEKSPLTKEQATAVVCFDNRVQVVAAAGSGKTSTMVAKAGYALHRRLVQPHQILMMAFNKDAADELRQRVKDRLTPMGYAADSVAAQTFHAFGLNLIGEATGRRPSLASWLEGGQDVSMVMHIVDVAREQLPGFRRDWDLFRLVLARDISTFGEDELEPEDAKPAAGSATFRSADWDHSDRTSGFLTLDNVMVKSRGEETIANWLFINGVRYEYEKPYARDVVDATHRQYRPDFYYPAIDSYHEHWGLDRDGNPPASFTNYLDGVAWKRALHRAQGTTLLETTSAGVWDASAFEYLTSELTRRGVELDWNPDRPMPGKKPIEHLDLARTFRTFLVHAKSNRLSDVDLRQRLVDETDPRFQFRHDVFLRIFETIRAEWEHQLQAEGAIDFEDMLNQAADLLESGEAVSDYELVMVDEMQDASHARARLARALVNSPGRHLFAVGDDWQSINRFAGADISVMTEFEAWFGEGETLRLERTFRSPQSLCDISSAFVTKNPSQLAKRVTSAGTEYPPTIRAVQAETVNEVRPAIEQYLSELDRQVGSGEIESNKDGNVSVDILGRYRHDKQVVPDPSLFRSLNITFRTIHGSKGLEADYVVIPGLINGGYGFPSSIVDDPVLHLAMPAGDTFLLSEERRLFYVALTRARRSVLLLTVDKRQSAFMTELINDGAVKLETTGGTELEAEICSKCGTGLMVERIGKFGAFLACNRYPKCQNTRNIAAF